MMQEQRKIVGLWLALDCSTGHVSADEAVALNAGTCPLRMTNHEHGWTIFLQEDLPDPQTQGWEEFPNLHKVVAFALQLKCALLNFDSDGTKHAELQEFAW